MHDRDIAISKILDISQKDRLETERYKLLIECLVKNQYSKEIELSEKQKELSNKVWSYIKNSSNKLKIVNYNYLNLFSINNLLGYGDEEDQKIEIYNEEHETKSRNQEIDIIIKELEQNEHVPQFEIMKYPILSELEERFFEKEQKGKLDLFLPKDLTIEEIEEVMKERVTRIIKEIEIKTLKELLKQKSQATKILLEAKKDQI